MGGVFTVADNDLTVREMLIAMNGKLDVITAEHTHTRASMTEVRRRCESLELEINGIHKAQAVRDGERKGFMTGARVIVFLSSISGLGGVAAFAKTFLAGHG